MEISAITSEELASIYSRLASAEVILKEDPTEDGEYAGHLYLQELIAKVSVLREELAQIRLRVNFTLSQTERSVRSFTLAERILKNPKDYAADKVKAIQAKYALPQIRDLIEQKKLHLTECKLLQEAAEHRSRVVDRCNSDIRLQEKVLENQTYLTLVGRGKKPGSGLKKKMEAVERQSDTGKKSSSTHGREQGDIPEEEIESLVNT